jgi:amino acid transporter
VAEEVKRPERNLPLGIVVALAVSTLLYVLVVLVALLSVPMDELVRSKAPLAMVYDRATQGSGMVMGAIGMLAVVNGVLVQIIMASRIVYGMGANGWLPRHFASVHPRTRTPVAATVAVTGIVLVLALWFPLVKLAGATSFLLLAVFTVVNVALVHLKRRQPHMAGVVPCPTWVPVAGAGMSIGLLLAGILSS